MVDVLPRTADQHTAEHTDSSDQALALALPLPAPAPIPFPRRPRRGEPLADPSSVAEAEQQLLFLRRAADEIVVDLEKSPEETCDTTGMYPREYPAWRASAERSLTWKRYQIQERELWVTQQARVQPPALDAHQALTLARDTAVVLLARANEVLRSLQDDLDNDLTAEEAQVLEDVAVFLRACPAQPPLAGVA